MPTPVPPPPPSPDPLQAAKVALRTAMRAALAAIKADDAWWMSGNACRRIAEIPAWNAAKTVLVYAPLPDEPNCTPAAMVALECGVRVCVPRVDWANKRLEAVPITDFNADLLPDRHAVRSPRPDVAAVDPSEIDVVLVPGLAFDRAGGRLGRGGGFYDRFLSQAGVRAVKVGVGFGVQMVEAVPRDERDVRVDWVATEMEVVRCG